jgi:N-acyl-L-homoserine lactone synthetase
MHDGAGAVERAGLGTQEPPFSLDHAARHVLAANPSVRFSCARTPAEREELYRLRYEVCRERGWLRAEECPSGLEQDGYDDGALHLVGRIGGQLACTTRLVLPRADRLLPLQMVFGHDLFSGMPQRLVEADRTVVVPPVRDPEHRLLAVLVARVWLEASTRGYTGIAAFLSAPMVRLYRHMGLVVTTLGPAHRYYGESRYPVVLLQLSSTDQIVHRFGRPPEDT